MSRIFVSVSEPIPLYSGTDDAPRGNLPPAYIRCPTRPESPSTFSESRNSLDESMNTKKGFLNFIGDARRAFQPSRADQPIAIPETMSIETYDRAWRKADIPLPEFLKPSLANASYCCGLVSSPDSPGEEPVMDWEKTMRIAGLGKVECLVYSSYVSHFLRTPRRAVVQLTAVCLRIRYRLSTSIHRA
jgi:hypothetical protein